MHISNSILNTLDIDTEDFRYADKVPVIDDFTRKPFGQVTFSDGHYKLTVGRDVIPKVKGFSN